MSVFRMVRIGTLGVLTVAVAAVGSSAGWVRTERGSSWLADRIESVVRDQLAAGGVDVGAARLGVGVVVLEDVRIHGVVHRDVLVVPRAHARFDVQALFDQHVDVSELTLQRPSITLHRLADGSFDLPRPESSPTPNPGPPTFLPAGWIAEARVYARGLAIGFPDDGLHAEQGTLRASLRLSHDRLSVADGSVVLDVGTPELGEVGAMAELALHHADLEHLSVEVAAEGLGLEITGAIPGALGAPTLDLDVVARAERAGWERWAEALEVSVPALELGAAGIRAELQGPVGAPAVAAEVFLASQLPDVFDRGPAGTLQVDVRESSPVDVRLSGVIPRAEDWRPLGSPLEAGSFTFAGRLGGPALSDARLTLGVEGHWVSLPPVVAPELTADLRLGMGASRMLSVDLSSDAFDVVLETGTVPLSGEVAVVQSGDLLTAGLAVADRRNAERRIDAGIEIDVEATTARASSLALRTGGGMAFEQTSPTVVDWSTPSVTTDLVGEAGHVALDASFADEWPRGRIALDGLDLARLRDAVQPFVEAPLPEVSGLLTARVDTKDGGHPWSLSLAGLGVDQRLRGLSASLDGILGRDVVTLEGTLLDTQGALVEVDATVPLLAPRGPSSVALACGSSGLHAALASAPRSTEALAELVFLEPPTRASDVMAQLTLGGDPCDPNIHLEVDGRPDLGDLEVATHLELRDGPEHTARMVLHTLLNDATRAEVHATVDHVALPLLVERGLDGVGSFALDADLDGLPSQLWLHTAPGQLDGRVAVAGTGSTVTEAAGTVRFAPAGPDTPLPPAHLALSTRDDTLGVTLRLGAPDATPAPPTVEARVELTDLHDLGLDAPIAGEIRGLALTVADLATLGEVDVRRATGALQIDGPFGGTLGRPDPDLRIELTDGAAALPALGVRYEDVHVLAHLEGDTFTVRQGELASRPRSRTLRQVGRGMQISGTVTRDADGTIRPDLAVALNRSWLLAARDTTLQASGEVRLKRPDDVLRLEGDVRVDEGRMLLERSAFAVGGPNELHPDIVFVDTLPPTAFHRVASPATAPFVDLDLDLDVDLGAGVALEATVPLLEQADAVGQAFDVAVDGVLTGSLDVSQQDGVLDLRGRLDPMGRVELLTARFDIEEGSVAFAGGDLTEPTLDLQLRRDSGAYGTVRARVQGTPSTLSLSDLTSDEASTQEDVVSLLLFGRPLGEIDPESSGAGGIAVEQALLSVAGRQVEQALGGTVVDTVDYSSDDGLSFGFALGGSGFLTVSVDPLADEDENTAQARLTWLLTRRVEAGIESGDTGTSAGWIVWRRRF